MTNSTLTYSGSLVVLTCWCGMRHAVPQELREFQQRQHADGRRDVTSIYCPLGHAHIPSGEGAAERLEKELAAQREYAESLNGLLTAEQRSHAATKGQVTKLRKRVVAGVCPFGCHRHFVNLERHVASQHPGATLDGE